MSNIKRPIDSINCVKEFDFNMRNLGSHQNVQAGSSGIDLDLEVTGDRWQVAVSQSKNICLFHSPHLGQMSQVDE